MTSPTTGLYRLACPSETARAARNGHAGRRAKNGRALGRAGFWRGLWR